MYNLKLHVANTEKNCFFMYISFNEMLSETDSTCTVIYFFTETRLTLMITDLRKM